MSAVNVKICGLTCETAVKETVAAGADYIGFVFFEKSPRNLDLDAAKRLGTFVPRPVKKVALLVDPTDTFLTELTETFAVDFLQLQGSETPERVAEIKALTQTPVIKALGIADPDDLANIANYETAADQILLDAKAPKDAERPGGNGLKFDWSLLGQHNISLPWMLAGGLTAENVTEALRISGANQVDVSSAVERAPGVKDTEKVRAFIQAAKSA